MKPSRSMSDLMKAAIRVWSRDPEAPLFEIAREAGWSKSMIHYYFSDYREFRRAVWVYYKENPFAGPVRYAIVALVHAMTDPHLAEMMRQTTPTIHVNTADVLQ